MELALYTAASANTFLGRVTRGVQPICYFTSSCEGIPFAVTIWPLRTLNCRCCGDSWRLPLLSLCAPLMIVVKS